MTNYAPPATIRERLLSEAVRRHELSSIAVPAIQDLVQRGLSFEQALVGTGLISPQTFTEWMREASGLSILTPSHTAIEFPAGLERETVQAWQIIPEKMSGKQWLIGLTNPWDQEVRSALAALAAEHDWQPEFAYVLPSVADRWLRALDLGQRSAEALRRYARSLLDRMDQERALSLVQSVQAVHPRTAAVQIPSAWLAALQLRLARRTQGTPIQVRQNKQTKQSKIELHAPHERQMTQEEEHPVRDWSEAFHGYFQEGKLVFLLDTQGNLLKNWPDVHVEHATEEWRSGKRWVAESDPAQQEELFHLALAGYPGTVCFRSTATLDAWERAATEAEVSYAACIGRVTDHGIAWSLYTV